MVARGKDRASPKTESTKRAGAALGDRSYHQGGDATQARSSQPEKHGRGDDGHPAPDSFVLSMWAIACQMCCDVHPLAL